MRLQRLLNVGENADIPGLMVKRMQNAAHVVKGTLADAVVLVHARRFGANPETLRSNAFQRAETEPGAAAAALHEQEALALALAARGVQVIRLEPPPDSVSPDALFPNNWFSTHEDGRLVLYPMEAPSRRTECIADLADRLRERGFHVASTVDLAPHAEAGRFLEGTGSLVLDRAARVAYACPSSRTHIALAREWAARFGYRLCTFEARDPAGLPVYHTNVVLGIGAGLAIACFDAISRRADRDGLRNSLEASGLGILEIRWPQVAAFAGNQLFLQGAGGPVVVLSSTANAALSDAQKALLDRHAERCVVDVATIERHGGGSVRCMLAEIFLPRLRPAPSRDTDNREEAVHD